MKKIFLCLSVSVFLAVAARGQSALDGFDPNANNVVRAVLVQPDGKILLGGDFTALAPNGGVSVTRNHIARLNRDGTLDTAFNPNADGSVYALALQTDGKILAGGNYASIGGQPRNFIARLDATTGLADSFNPNANNSVFAIALQTDGKIVVGGFFAGANSIGGQTRGYIARLDPATGLADSFSPNANNPVLALVVQPDSKILAGGSFTSFGGQTRNRLARLNSGGTLDTGFDPNANGEVDAIAVLADGRIWAGGQFTIIAGQPRIRIARLNGTNGSSDALHPDANNSVRSIVVLPDSRILVAGDFNGTNSIGGQTRNYIARLSQATGAADSFNPNASNSVLAIAAQPDGRILAGGRFATVGGLTRNRLARLEPDGRVDQTLDLSVVGSLVFATAVQPDGKILIGGRFSSVLGLTRNNIARLHPDGALDIFFNPNANSDVTTIALQADGRILAGGAFTSIGGQTRNRIARLDVTTGAADSFNPNANSSVFSIAVQADGRVLVGGAFATIGGLTRNRIARLDPATGAADSFDPNANSFVYSIALQVDGKILAGGVFTSIGGLARNRIARLDPATGLADSFNPVANSQVSSIAVQPDGKILAGGMFTFIGLQTRNFIARLDSTNGFADSFNPNANSPVYSIALQADRKILVGGVFSGANSIGGQTRNRIARLDPATGLADSFNPNASNVVYSIAVQTDGKVLAGGQFLNIGGQARVAFARLQNDTVALQDLTVGQNAVTWMRDGSSPQFSRVIFEDSTNDVTYNFLGNGSASGSDWTLTGLNLSTGTNLYIRARGYYSSGYENGSGSIAESVRNAFLIPATPLQLTTAVSRKTHGGAGTFDIPLPLSGEPGVECRSTGGGDTLVFNFSNNVVSGNASVTTGVGSVAGSPTFVGNTMTVNLTGVDDVQKITVTLSGVTDSFAQVLPNTAVSMNVLLGDTNGNKTVNASDIAQTKAQSGSALSAANFRNDTTVSGSINASDIGLVKTNSGHNLP